MVRISGGGKELGSNNKRQRTSSPTNLSSGDGEKRSDTYEGKKCSALVLDLDVLDCPVCMEPLTHSVFLSSRDQVLIQFFAFECDNGHLASSSCCTKLNNECPACASPVGKLATIAAEKWRVFLDQSLSHVETPS